MVYYHFHNVIKYKTLPSNVYEEHNKRFVQLFMRNRSENPEYFIFWALRDEPDTNTIHVFTGQTTRLKLLTQ
uniref:Uncharacterized protein n=1 Tax=Anguilla anguilla TaxID=7936 RepID=A0A0E9WVQ6_ANGAN